MLFLYYYYYLLPLGRVCSSRRERWQDWRSKGAFVSFWFDCTEHSFLFSKLHHWRGRAYCLSNVRVTRILNAKEILTDNIGFLRIVGQSMIFFLRHGCPFYLSSLFLNCLRLAFILYFIIICLMMSPFFLHHISMGLPKFQPDLGFVCFVVNPRVLSANRVDLGFLFQKFSNLNVWVMERWWGSGGALAFV